MVDAMPEPKTETTVPPPKAPRPAPLPPGGEPPEGVTDPYGWGV